MKTDKSGTSSYENTHLITPKNKRKRLNQLCEKFK